MQSQHLYSLLYPSSLWHCLPADRCYLGVLTCHAVSVSRAAQVGGHAGQEVGQGLRGGCCAALWGTDGRQAEQLHGGGNSAGVRAAHHCSSTRVQSALRSFQAAEQLQILHARLPGNQGCTASSCQNSSLRGLRSSRISICISQLRLVFALDCLRHVVLTMHMKSAERGEGRTCLLLDRGVEHGVCVHDLIAQAVALGDACQGALCLHQVAKSFRGVLGHCVFPLLTKQM